MGFKSIFFFAVLFVMVACSSTSPVKNDTVTISTTNEESGRNLVRFERQNRLSAVLETAKRQNKPVFIDFYTSWCGPCKMMDKEVFSDRHTAQMLNKNFINFKVNAEKAYGPDLATIYNVGSFPTLLFLDADGKVLLRHEGMAYTETMKKISKIALEAFES